MKIILIFILTILNYLYANVDYITLYRTAGISAVEKSLNKQLRSSKYWKNKLSKKNVERGYHESVRHILVCDTNLNNINIYDTTNNELVFTSSVLSGRNKGGKVLEGDLKTPLGVYKLTSKLSKVDKFYGPFALVTNYPNKFDKSLGRTGHGIWIHGVPFDKKRDIYTKGCIALDNDKLQQLGSNIIISNSLLVINDNNNKLASIDDISVILSGVYAWREAWKYSNLNDYLDFYSKEFKRKNGRSLSSFIRHKTRIFKRKGKKTIRFTNLNITPNPNNLNKNMYKISMHEYYKAGSYKFVGKKELFVEIINNKMEILFE